MVQDFPKGGAEQLSSTTEPMDLRCTIIFTCWFDRKPKGVTTDRIAVRLNDHLDIVAGAKLSRGGFSHLWPGAPVPMLLVRFTVGAPASSARVGEEVSRMCRPGRSRCGIG